MLRSWTPLLLVCLLAWAPTAQAWDFDAPEERNLDGTAYSLAPKQWSLNVGLLGTGDAELFGELGVGYGLGFGLDLKINLLHVGVGMINVEAGWNFLDTEYVGLGLSVGFVWGHGEWMWILPAEQRALAQGLDIFIIPMWVTASFPLVDWFQADLAFGYMHAEIVGALDEGGLFYDGSWGSREVTLRPAIRFNVPGGTQFVIGGSLPLWAASPSNLEAAVELQEGVYAGVRTADYQQKSFADRAKLSVTVRSELAHTLWLDFTVHYSELARKVYGSPIGPSVRLSKRF